jgi:hypothetical protein
VVKKAGVVPMYFANRASQGVVAPRAHDEMNVIGHQAVGPELQPVPFACASQTPEIVVTISLREKDLAPAVAAMGHMMRQAGDDDSRYS